MILKKNREDWIADHSFLKHFIQECDTRQKYRLKLVFLSILLFKIFGLLFQSPTLSVFPLFIAGFIAGHA